MIPRLALLASPGLTGEEIEESMKPIILFSLRDLERDRRMAVPFKVPSSGLWARVRERLGNDPGYFIGARSTSSKSAMVCFERSVLRFEVKRRNVPLDSEEFVFAPFPYHTPYTPPEERADHVACEATGIHFRAMPGDVIDVEVLLQRGAMLPEGEVCVWPYRGTALKDKLVGADIDAEIRPVSRITTPMGAGLLAFGLLRSLFARRRR